MTGSGERSGKISVGISVAGRGLGLRPQAPRLLGDYYRHTPTKRSVGILRRGDNGSTLSMHVRRQRGYLLGHPRQARVGLSPSRPPFDLKLFALCSQYHGLDQICNKKMHSKINNFRHRESKSVRIYKGRGAFQTKIVFSETLASGVPRI